MFQTGLLVTTFTAKREAKMLTRVWIGS
ncbi:unnamed protein product [Calypogeia fissa]